METFAIITRPSRFLKDNANRLYISKNLGTPNLDVEDEVGIEIKKLKLEYEFNINEMFILRSFDTTKFCVYVPMERQLFYLSFTEKIINATCALPNIVVCYLNDSKFVVVNVKDLTYQVYTNVKKTFDACLKLSLDFLKSELTTRINVVPEKEIKLPRMRTLEKKMSKSQLVLNNDLFEYESLLACFFLNGENCLALEQEGKIVNAIVVNNKTYSFTNWEFFDFLNVNYYNIIRDRVLVK